MDCACTYLRKAGNRWAVGEVIQWIVLGLLAGAVAKLWIIGDARCGFSGSLIVGVTGALAGGFIARVLWEAEGKILSSTGRIVPSILGAIFLLFLYALPRGRNSDPTSKCHERDKWVA